MNDHPEEKTPTDADEQALDRLIRAAAKEKSAPFERPRDDSIAAYLSGSATLQQRGEVQKALLHSAKFRQELLLLEEDLRRLDESTARTRFDAGAVGPIPDRRVFLRQVGQPSPDEESEGEGGDETGLARRTRSWLASVLDTLRGGRATSRPRPTGAHWGPLGWRLTGALVLAGLAVVILVSPGLLQRGPRGPHSLELLTVESLPQSAFGPVRSGSPHDQVIVGPTAREAAARSFMRRIGLTDGEFHLLTENQPGAAAGLERTVRLGILIGDERAPHSVILRVPQDAADLQVWLLSVPSLGLAVSRVKGESVNVVVPRGTDNRWCAAVTYRVSEGYAASEAAAVAGWD